jgi:hypothetical protein
MTGVESAAVSKSSLRKSREEIMKTRTILVSLVLVLSGAALCLAAGVDFTPFMGTWKLDEAKSKIPAGGLKNTTVVYTAMADNMVKVTTDGVDKNGKPSHTEWTGKFDGKEYPVTGSNEFDMWAYTAAGHHTLHMVLMKGGKTVATGTIAVAADGKSRTVTIKSSEPALNFVGVYNKE